MSIKDDIRIIDTTKKEENFFCKLCSFPLISYIDFRRHEEYSACENCFLHFVEARKKEWLEGWRPSEEIINEYIKARKQS